MRGPVVAGAPCPLDDAALHRLEIAAALRNRQRRLGQIGAKRNLAGAGLNGAAQQGRLQVPVLQHARRLAKKGAIEKGDAGPARIGIDPLEAVIGSGFRHRQQCRRAGADQARHVRTIRHQPVGEHQQPIARRHSLSGVRDAARDHGRDPFRAKPFDHRREFGGNTLHQDHHRAGPGLAGKPRLALDQAAAGKRHGCPQAARRIGRVMVSAKKCREPQGSEIPRLSGRG
jgi:hypothetical protein